MKMKNVFRYLCLGAVLLCVVICCAPTDTLAKRVYRLPIEGTIDRGLAPYIRRVLQEALHADAVILEINTLGGLVDSAIQIRDALLNTNTQTIAFINKRAISAGALISLATDHIIMSPGSTIGAATPIQLDVSGQGNPVSEKYVSYFRTEMRATAEQTGRRGDIAEAMVDADVEIEGIIEKGKLLTLTTGDALQYEIAEGEASDLSQVLDAYDLSDAEVVTVEINWAEQIVRMLTNPVVSSLLMTLGLIGLFIEFRTPGFGVGGALGLLCLGLFFWGHFIVRLAGWEELILFTAGVILLLIELLIIPGFGVVGVLGIFSIIASLALAMVGRLELLTFQDIQMALSKVTASLIATIILSVVFAKLFPRTSIGQQFILKTTQDRQEGFVAQRKEQHELIGMTGITLTPLHPSGTMVLDHIRYDVVSEGGFIEKGVHVNVISVEGARIVVRLSEEQK